MNRELICILIELHTSHSIVRDEVCNAATLREDEPIRMCTNVECAPCVLSLTEKYRYKSFLQPFLDNPISIGVLYE